MKSFCGTKHATIVCLLFSSFCLFLFAFFFFPIVVLAYTEISEGPELITTLTPSTPGTNMEASVALESFTLDLERATISWYLDDTLKDSGVARKNFSFRTGRAGQSLRLAIVVETPEKISAQKVITLNPADVGLVWEAQTYTPPAYRGKALPSPGSSVRVVALPNFVNGDGVVLQTNDLIYEWERDFSKIYSASGRGKRSLTLTMPEGLAETDVHVTVRETDGSLTAENRLTLKPVQPQIRFYEEQPLEGTLYERAMKSSLDLRRDEITLRAEPYGMFASGKPLLYDWRVDGVKTTPHESAKNLLTLRLGAGNSGSSILFLAVENPINAVAIAAQLLVNFGK